MLSGKGELSKSTATKRHSQNVKVVLAALLPLLASAFVLTAS